MMLKETFPLPQNEMQRLLSLSELDLDYSELSKEFKDLAMLAAKVAGTGISLINLIDSYTTWTISGHGLEIQQVPREESLCQYTIMGESQFEVCDLSIDKRFEDKDFTKPPMSLRYYLGVPITDPQGYQIGSLCVVDTQPKNMSPEKIEMLKIIADQVINRIQTYQAIKELKGQVKNANEIKSKVAHDIRGPLAGIIGLSSIIVQQGNENNLSEVLEFIQLIHKSSKSLLELADEILTEDEQGKKLAQNEVNLNVFKCKLEDLYGGQAKNKGIRLNIQLNEGDALFAFPKNKLLQIAGNLISNAIKFTPESGLVKVDMSLIEQENQHLLDLMISDTGAGISEEALQHLEEGSLSSTNGTCGEKGYGFGLDLVKHLVRGLGGTMHISNLEGSGACFKLSIPFQKIPA
ncbi:GAF domain-containing sensor histidine kinase [Pedobacter gandavensis]|uniref:GAF domain-containing sensor histidine kinase n=1 Tax=Pedobacter TaxID=84567 RepID=UPI001C99617D|nr:MULTISPECIES: GAF domain-containing sensor histidine kinase [Pedobacter]WGQ10573.1 GAF domain-containing sensor histidine kinase [Pedobacter gandavensis]